MAGPLAGLRVVDCSTGTAGPRLTGLLADYGADVIWVEPRGGDPLRDELAVPYSVFNRGKRSIVLDLRDDRFQELLRTADVFVESWEPGQAERLGLGWEELHAQFPALVHTSITGFGPEGRHRDLPAHESLVHAVVGTTGEQVGHRDAPIYEGLPFASLGAHYLAAIGTLAALHRRHADGHGRHVETSLLDGALSYLAMLWGDSDDENLTPGIQPGAKRLVARTFRCADDEYIGVHTAAVGAFGRLIRALGLQDRVPCAEDGTDMLIPLTPEQSRIVMDEIPEIFLTKPRSYWLETLLEADVCAIPALRPGEVLDEPQARHNEMVVEVDDPVLGRVQQVAPPAKLAATPPVVGGPAPTVGQHTDEVLAELGTVTGAPAPTGALLEDAPVLDGLKVLDLGAYYAGPYSARLLADLGADVIKLETTLGDQLRGIARPFRSAQAGKRGISVNLKDPELAPALESLVSWADVVAHNMRPGAAERLGVGFEQVHAHNPKAVYLYAPGWGATGPDSQRQSFAPMLSGYVGASHEVAGQYNEPLFPLGNEDPGNGLLGAVAVLLALLQRDRTGQGQYVENSQLNATMSHMAHVVRRDDGEVLGAMRLDTLQTGVSALDRLYETSDGWLAVAVFDSQAALLGELLGVDVAGDARFATRAARAENDQELSWAFADVFATRTSEQWLKELAASGLGAVLPATSNNNRAFHRDPANHATGRVVEVEHPTQGVLRELAHLVRVSGASRAPHRLAPELGEHTDEVLRELGYDDDTLTRLRARGSIRSA